MYSLIDTGLPRSMIITISVSVFAVLLLSGFVLYMWVSQERASEKAHIMKGITDSLGAGVVNYILNSEGRITSVGNGYYKLTGYNEKEVAELFGFCFYNMLAPKYREYFKTREYKNGEELQEELELYTKNGLRWMLFNGRVVQRKGVLTISAVIIDINETKKLHEKVAIQQERYRLATELSNDIVLNYSILDDTLNISENFRTYFGGETCIPSFTANKVWEKGFVHEDDIEKVAELIRIITLKGSEIDQQIRIKNIEGEYIWCRLICMSVKDELGTNREYVGKLINIDLHKKELGRLEKKAMRDSLTGAYNKEYTKTLINDYICDNPDKSGILFMIDIDKFKLINDNFGHIAGDKVIIEVVEQLQHAFRSTDIVGRIGGDEFVVFVCNVSDMEEQIRQARKLQSVLRMPVDYQGQCIEKSASIGVALFPAHGKDYETLLGCADKALYKVKGNGRDAFEIYSDKAEPVTGGQKS